MKGLQILVLAAVCAVALAQGPSAAPCAVRCACGLQYDPVCGTDGQTYTNQACLDCTANCAKDLKVDHKGECKKPCETTCACAAVFDPVCGNDGKTYSNEGCLECQKECNPSIKMLSKGECTSAASTTSTLAPITGKPTEGACDASACICTRVYQPVCGSDGKTYSNEGCLDCAAKCNKNLKMAREGECEEAEQSSTVKPLPSGGLAGANEGTCATGCICSQSWAPVCGTNNQTYTNQACLDCEAGCKSNLKTAYAGECSATPPTTGASKDPEACKNACVCAQNWEPVCGTDKKTYTNEGCLSCAAECSPNEIIKVLQKGECPSASASSAPASTSKVSFSSK